MKLKLYRDGITANDDVMKDQNPLFINDYLFYREKHYCRISSIYPK